MKSILFEKYGPPEDLKFGDVPTPIPEKNQVLLKVHASALNAADWHIMRASPFIVRPMIGLRKPRRPFLGMDIAGEIVAVGAEVKEFKTGDQVFGCLSNDHMGAFAEYACVRPELLAHKPARSTFAEAAALPLAGLTALQALRNFGAVEPGQKVLINGASGGVGTYAVQIAKALGAEVTAVCSAKNQDLARTLGADHVLDYAKSDFTQQANRYHLILGVNGYHPISDYQRALVPNGVYGMIGGTGRQMAEAIFLGPILTLFGKRKLGLVSMKPNQKDLLFLKDLMESGKVVSIIDRSYSLEQVPEAIRYLEEGHSRGKIVITM